MKIKLGVTLITLLYITCSKENNQNNISAVNSNNTIAVRDTAKIPLNDLGTATYRGYMGGLYPNGSSNIFHRMHRLTCLANAKSTTGIRIR